MGEAIQEGRGPLGVAEDLHPLAETEVGGQDQGGLFVPMADQMEQQRTARFGERQVTQFVDDDGIDGDELLGQVTSLAELFFVFPLVDEVDGVIEPDPLPPMDRGDPQGGRQMGFAGSGAPDEDQVMRLIHEGGGGQWFHLSLMQGRFSPRESQQITVDRTMGGTGVGRANSGLAGRRVRPQ